MAYVALLSLQWLEIDIWHTAKLSISITVRKSIEHFSALWLYLEKWMVHTNDTLNINDAIVERHKLSAVSRTPNCAELYQPVNHIPLRDDELPALTLCGALTGEFQCLQMLTTSEFSESLSLMWLFLTYGRNHISESSCKWTFRFALLLPLLW